MDGPLLLSRIILVLGELSSKSQNPIQIGAQTAAALFISFHSVSLFEPLVVILCSHHRYSLSLSKLSSSQSRVLSRNHLNPSHFIALSFIPHLGLLSSSSLRSSH